MGATFVPTTKSIMGAVNVRDYGAKGDGVADDTAAIQAALNAAPGITCLLPGGNYLCNSTLSIPADTALVGTWKGMPRHEMPNGFANPTTTGGTCLLTTQGAGSISNTPFITLNHNSVVRGLSIQHPNQVTTDPPTLYPPTIYGNGTVGACVEEVELLNSYIGIKLSGGGGHVVRNITMQAFLYGLYLDGFGDVSRFENIQVIPLWTRSTAAEGWAQNNGTGFFIQRVDQSYFVNCFAFTMHVGFGFYDDGATGQPSAAWANLTNCGADTCNYGIDIQAAQEYGVSFTGGVFIGGLAANVALNIGASVGHGSARFNGCRFAGTGTFLAIGSGDVLLDGCQIGGYTGSNSSAAIRSTGGNVQVNGCLFASNQPQMVIDTGTTKAIVTNNITAQHALSITNNISSAAIVTGNV